jgi:hypothetical protein
VQAAQTAVDSALQSKARSAIANGLSQPQAAPQVLPGLNSGAPASSIRELYSEWCVSVRMHAQASVLSAVPSPLAQRTCLSAKVLSSTNSGAVAFKGPRPTFKAVPGEEGLLEVSRGMGAPEFGDRLWLDQMKLTRCCIVKVHRACA